MNIKPTLPTAEEARSDMKKDQHNEELRDKLRRETESAEFKLDESKNWYGVNDVSGKLKRGF